MTESVENTGDRGPDGRFAKGNKARFLDGRFSRLPLGALPKSLRRLERSAYRLRRELEQATVNKFGSIDARRMTAIYAASRHFLSAELIAKRLSRSAAELPDAVLTDLVVAMSRETDKLLEAINSLGLDIDSGNGKGLEVPWDLSALGFVGQQAGQGQD